MARYLVNFLRMEQVEIEVEADCKAEAIDLALAQSETAQGGDVMTDYFEVEEIT